MINLNTCEQFRRLKLRDGGGGSYVHKVDSGVGAFEYHVVQLDRGGLGRYHDDGRPIMAGSPASSPDMDIVEIGDSAARHTMLQARKAQEGGREEWILADTFAQPKFRLLRAFEDAWIRIGLSPETAREVRDEMYLTDAQAGKLIDEYPRAYREIAHGWRDPAGTVADVDLSEQSESKLEEMRCTLLEMQQSPAFLLVMSRMGWVHLGREENIRLDSCNKGNRLTLRNGKGATYVRGVGGSVLSHEVVIDGDEAGSWYLNCGRIESVSRPSPFDVVKLRGPEHA